jgi:hypothetical protein
MLSSCDWVEMILDAPSTEAAWSAIFGRLGSYALYCASPVELNNYTVAPDRLLAESAWNLWFAYSKAAPRTSMVLRDWWAQSSSYGKAVLIMDAFSLRELPALIGGAETHGIKPMNLRVVGAEVPPDTDHFAKALGVPSRSSLANNRAPSNFVFAIDRVYTDILDIPFEDCVENVPFDSNVFFWHTWLDKLIHQTGLPDQVYKISTKELQGEGFWNFVNRIRKGRRLVITSDHGYAVGRQFSTEEEDRDVVEALRETFGASRNKPASESWKSSFMPPLVLTENGYHIVIGQRRWKVPSGFPNLSHGGLSLLDVAVPFVELPPL